MKYGEEFKGCRYWGYEPASSEFLHTPMPKEEKQKLRDKFQNDCKVIREFAWAEFKPAKMGFRTRGGALKAAQEIEDKTGIEMRIFNHDYLF